MLKRLIKWLSGFALPGGAALWVAVIMAVASFSAGYKVRSMLADGEKLIAVAAANKLWADKWEERDTCSGLPSSQTRCFDEHRGRSVTRCQHIADRPRHELSRTGVYCMIYYSVVNNQIIGFVSSNSRPRDREGVTIIERDDDNGFPPEYNYVEDGYVHAVEYDEEGSMTVLAQPAIEI